MTSEDREAEIADYIAYLDSVLQSVIECVAPDVEVTALGFSQGVATVSRWVAASKPNLARVILWGGLLPPEFKDTSGLGGLLSQPLSLVVGDTDRYFPSSMIEAEVNRVNTLKIPVTVTRFPGGHAIDPQALIALTT